MKKKLLLLILVIAAALNADNFIDQEWQDSRICMLLPDLYPQLAIDPELPANYVAVAKSGKRPEIAKGLYWGPEKTVQDALIKRNWSELSHPIIHIKLEKNLKQKGTNDFEGDYQYYQQFKSKGMKVISADKKKWGEYPVRTFHAKTESGKSYYTAWIGLNDQCEQACLVAELIVPEKEKHPSKKDVRFWEDFINYTQSLSGYAYYKAHGQEIMEDGKTLFNFAGCLVEFVAEKRKADEQIQIVVRPRDKNVKFACSGVYRGVHVGELQISSILGRFIKLSSHGRDFILKTRIFLHPKPVKEFTYNQENIVQYEGSQIYTNLLPIEILDSHSSMVENEGNDFEHLQEELPPSLEAQTTQKKSNVQSI